MIPLKIQDSHACLYLVQNEISLLFIILHVFNTMNFIYVEYCIILLKLTDINNRLFKYLSNRLILNDGLVCDSALK